ncbi:MAG: ArsR/SmtB family transcription factor [Candidatus Thorarchaeota archaeon]
MSDDIDNIRKELEEVRRLKEELRREVDAVRREKEETQLRAEARQRKEELQRVKRVRPVKPPRPPRVKTKPPRPPRPARFELDLEGLTDSLETMMDGLGHQIEMSLRNVEGLKIPGIRINRGRRRTKRRRKERAEIESIAPERVARIVAPLGNEERLRIIDFLKTGGKSFNDIENEIGKTGSSLTHHLNPLIDAGYVVKGEVRGTYYVTVEGRLAYRLAQWLTHRVEEQRERNGKSDNVETEVKVDFEEETEPAVGFSYVMDSADEVEDLEAAEEHLETLAEELEEAADKVEAHKDELEEAREALEEELEEEEDLDALDWED